MVKTKRRTFTEDFKKKTVVRLKQKGLSVATESEKLGIAQSVLRNWLKKYGDVITELPTENSTGRGTYRRTKKLVATQFACPHCGGPITLEE